MDTSTILTVVSIAVLVTFAAWALGPVVKANRKRILKSPATWAVMILCCSILWLRWEQAKTQRWLDAQNASLDLREKIADRQSARTQKAILKQADKVIAQADRDLGIPPQPTSSPEDQ